MKIESEIEMIFKTETVLKLENGASEWRLK